MLIQYYLLRTVLGTTFIVLLSLVGIAALFLFMGEVHSFGRGDYGVLPALHFVLLKLPMQAVQLFPVSILLGTVLGLGTLANSSELTVMRCAGVSPLKLILMLLKTLFVLALVVLVFAETMAPHMEHQAERIKSISRAGGQALATKHGVWLRQGKEFIHIALLRPGARLFGISRFIYDDNYKLHRTSFAKTADFKQQHWTLHDVQTTTIAHNHSQTEHVAHQPWALPLGPDLLSVTNIEPQEMNLKQLYDYIIYLKANNLDSLKVSTDFWRRVFQPLATLVMIFLAVPLLFGPLRQCAMGLRIVGGALLGFSFYALNYGLIPVTLYLQIPGLLTSAVPILLFALLAYYLLKRVH